MPFSVSERLISKTAKELSAALGLSDQLRQDFGHVPYPG